MKRLLFVSIILVCFSSVWSQTTVGLVGHWTLDNNVQDASGSNFHGINNGGVFTTSAKVGSHAMTFNGSNQSVDLGNPALPAGTSARTMAAWIKVSAISEGFRFAAAYGTAVYRQSMFLGQNGAGLVAGANADHIQINDALQAGVWKHACLTYDGTTAKVYLDGVLVSTVVKEWTLVLSKAYIGRQVNDNFWEYWNGAVDDVRIYDRVLTSTEVETLAGILPTSITPPSNLTAAAASQIKIGLNWIDNSTDETGFQIERSETTGTGFQLVATTAANTVSYIDNTLSPGVTYYYRIRAANSSAYSSYTAEVSAKTLLNPNSLVAYWRLDNNVLDESGNNLNGTNVGGIFSADRKDGTHSMSFNGSSQYVNLGNPSALPSRRAARSMAAWIKPAMLDGGLRFAVSYGTAMPQQAMFVGQNNAALVAGAYGDDLSVPNVFQPGVWKHVCLTYDGTTAKVYIDGMLSASAAKNWDLILSRAFIGRQVNDNFWESWYGLVDDVRIYNKALTQVEVQTIVNGAVPLASVEFRALKDMYDNLGGANWTQNENWPTTGNWPQDATVVEIDAWDGVIAQYNDDGGFISGLEMQDFNLSGELPSSIWSMPHTGVLRLSQNNITGFSSVPNNNIQWTGYEVDLSNNQISSVPEFISTLYTINTLNLSHNKITNLPANIGDLDCYELSLQDNLLTSLPESFGNLSNIIWSVVDLSNNKLTSLPESIANISVNVYNNELTTLPASLISKGLDGMDVSNNRLDMATLESCLATTTYFTYAPQKAVLYPPIRVSAGSSLVITATPMGQNSTTSWEKKIGNVWTDVTAQNEDTSGQTFKRSSSQDSDGGVYRWSMTNTSLPDLTLASEPIQVNITDAEQPSGYKAQALYNGLITSVRWRTAPAYQTGESAYSGMYLYEYDEKYQIKDATFAVPDFTLNTYSIDGNRFRLTGMTYDPNGNIYSLKRYDELSNRKHNFQYHYKANTNQLEDVTGYTSQGNPAGHGFQYNALGQMTGEDLLEENADQFVEYDVTGKVRFVYADEARTIKKIENQYDDRGYRLAKIVFKKNEQGNNVANRTTWYIRDASGKILSVYEQEGEPAEDNVAPLTLVEMPLYGSGKLGTFYPEQDGSVNYELTDHLGNVRALVRDNIQVYPATMEDNNQESLDNPRVEELQYFENLFETEVTDARMNHTKPTKEVPTPNKAAYLYWVDGTPGMGAEEKSVGPSIALKVNAGDKIDVETYARYASEEDYTEDITLLAASQFLGGTFAGSPGFDGKTAEEVATTFQGILPGFNGAGEDNTQPRAFLNYIVFNTQMISVAQDRIQVSDLAGFEPTEIASPDMFEKLSGSVTITQPGYIYVWVSNASENTRVWFDDLMVTHQGNVVVQSTDYGVWGDVLREQKTDESVYRFGYQGQFAEKDKETGWTHFDLREYEPVIGRWTSTDPYGQYWSPFVGMGNDPVNGADPDGGYSRRGAWWRNGFSFDGVYESGGEFGFNSSGADGAVIPHFGDEKSWVTWGADNSMFARTAQQFLEPGMSIPDMVMTRGGDAIEFDAGGQLLVAEVAALAVRGGIIATEAILVRRAAVAVSGGVARSATWGGGWMEASLEKAVLRHAGPNNTSWVTKTGKMIFENPTTGRQVVLDVQGKYFRIFQPRVHGSMKGQYLDLLGKTPTTTFFGKGGLKTIQLQGSALEQATHFIVK